MRTIFYILFCFALIACGKEGALDSQIRFDNLYTIQDDPDNPVKHEIYNIYEEYGVPVYFNDTIGKVFLKNNEDGQPIYQIEKLDLAWKYDSYEKIRYSYRYITESDRKLEILGLIRDYLDDADKPLYPFCFFVPDTVIKEDIENDDTELLDNTCLLGFRTLTMIMSNWEEGSEKKNLSNMKRSMVIQRINNYSNDLIDFQNVSDPNWYTSKWWSDLDSTIPSGYACDVLDPDYEGDLTGAELETEKEKARDIAGRFGFVMGAEFGDGMFTPYDVKEDLRCFVKVMLATPDKIFRQQWGTYPLVMEKYEVLYKIITEKLGVVL